MTQLFNLNGGAEITSLDGAYGFYVVTVDSEGEPLQSGFVTLDTLKTFINTDPSVVPSSNPWRGCTLNRTSAFGKSSNTSWEAVPWQTARDDTDSFWSMTDPARITVPVGVTKMRFSCAVLYPANSSGYRGIALYKNGSTSAPGRFYQTVSAATLAHGMSAISAVMDVEEGDYFELRLLQNSGSTLDVSSSSSQTWFQGEVIEAAV